MQTTITAPDGHSFTAYTAIPAQPNGAGIIVIQEIFGVNADVRAKCDAWAAKGYTAMAPDIFARQEAGVDITPRTQADWDRAMALLGGFDVDKGVDDIIATLAALRGTCAKVGTVGYCLGGRLAYLMATRSDADANVSYYGVTIENYLAEAGNIRAPLLMHVAGDDAYVPKEAQAAIAAALGKISYVEMHTYAGQNHAFTRLNGDHYNAEAAALANGRTEAFFAKWLG